MTKEKKEEIQLFNIESFSIAQLPELQGKKEEIKTIIDANPIVEIINNETYEQAKKSRTAVRTLRTSIEKEQKDVKKKIKETILDAVDTEYDTLVTDIKKEENLRQDAVTAYENKKEQERKEKTEKEEKRIAAINKTINEYVAEWKTAFNLMVFETIEEVGAGFYESYTNFDLTVLEEFDSLFPEKIQELTEYLAEKTTSLTNAENIRLANLKAELQAKRLKEILPYIAFGEPIDPTTLADLDENEYQSTLLAKKCLFEADAREKEAKEKEEADKLEQEKTAIYEIRKNRLLEIGLKYSDEHDTFFLEEEPEYILLASDIKELGAVQFEEVFTESKDAIKTALTVVPAATIETPSPETLKGIEVEEKAIQTPTETTAAISEPENTTTNVCYHLTPNQCIPPELTWNDIIEEFKASGEKSYSKWLVDNYNPPTKKQA